MRADQLDGLVAVVTGASSGIGRQLADDLDRFGTAVIGVARREQELAELADGFWTEGGGFRVCDVSDTDAFAAVLAEVEDARGRIDLLVNCAGTEERVPTVDADLEHVRRVMDTNFVGAVAGTLAVLPGMLRRGRGYVLNVSSDQGRAPTPQLAAYSASKAALSAFTESVAHEVRSRGVHLHVLYPGWVPTEMGVGAVDRGMPMPPRAVRRTADEVSRAAIRGLGGTSIDINAAKLAALAPVVRAIAPSLYRRGIERAST